MSMSGGASYGLALAAMDADAEAALLRALAASGIGFSRRGPIIVPAGSATHADTFRNCVGDRIAPSLQSRVKAFRTDRPACPDAVIDGLLNALTLKELMELADVEWVREAVHSDSLFSVYQPILETSNGRLFGYEALIRARHPSTGETVDATPLIQGCRRLGLEHLLDRKARRSAIAGAAEIQARNARFFVNFLPNAVYDPDVCLRSTIDAADEVGMPPSRLVFEVVETEQVTSIPRLRATLDFFRKQGAAVALGDISSGFSAPRYLGELMPDFVKIDRELVAKCASSTASRQGLETLVSMARRLRIGVIAEGIETVEQMRVCAAAGAEYLQGFLFARPAMPPEAVSSSLFTTAQAKAA